MSQLSQISLIKFKKHIRKIIKNSQYSWAHDELVGELDQEYGDEIREFAGDYWKELMRYSDGFFTVHTILVYYWVILDSDYKNNWNDEERNLLQWIALFHDISKRGPPAFDSRDHIHPFQSGATVLKMFKEKGFIEIAEKDEETWNETMRLISESIREANSDDSYEVDYYKNTWKHVHDHTKLPEVFQFLSYFFSKDSWIIRVFKAIFFHQSINANEDFPNIINLSDKEVCNYLDETDLKLLWILMNNDTHSYCLPFPDEKNCKRIKQGIDSEFDRLEVLVSRHKEWQLKRKNWH